MVTRSHITLNEIKRTMVHYSTIGRWRDNDVIDAVLLFEEKKRVFFFFFSLSLARSPLSITPDCEIDNVNMRNEHHFSDVHEGMSNVGSLARYT